MVEETTDRYVLDEKRWSETGPNGTLFVNKDSGLYYVLFSDGRLFRATHVLKDWLDANPKKAD